MLLICAVLSLTISQSLWIWGAKSLGVMFASLHMNAVPFYVMVIMFFVFDHSWNLIQTIGALIVAIGVFIAQLKKSVNNNKVVLGEDVQLSFNEINFKNTIKKLEKNTDEIFNPIIKYWIETYFSKNLKKNLTSYFNEKNK